MADPETTGRSEPVHDESDEDASEAQAQVIASLRAQVTDLFSQVTQLNTKLVASYDRVSNLEDELHDTSSSLRNASVTISSLELERSHHLAALNTGLLVEKAHVTAELNRLMERATEEAAQRGQAESARHDIEKDLDDLSATLFDQANTMVAEARLSQAKSERKVQDAEQALKIAEDAVQDMQVQMQSLQAEKETAEREAREARVTVGKGKWVERDDVRVGEVPKIRFMRTHAPYAEFIAFVGHLRTLRVSQPAPPIISTLLGQPFIARLLNEDSEPTVRLDLAPSLNWLSRRSVLTAIHTGMLTVEPVPFSSLVQELHQQPQSTSSTTLSCALCGTPIARLPSTTPASRTHQSNGSSWFKYPLALSSTQNLNTGTTLSAESEPPGQVYIFRLATATTSAPPSTILPTHTSSASVSAASTSSRPPLNVSSSRVIQTQTHNSSYPLCTSNYCLTRLRSTCSLWAFVRVSIVERVWEEEVGRPPKPLGINGHNSQESPSPTDASAGNQLPNGAPSPSASEKPPIPPRRRRLWEMASALGERAVSWGKETGENIKEKEKDGTKKLPPPPPSHPSVPHPHAESPTSQVETHEPPPLPKRDIVHDTTTTDTVILPSDTPNETRGLTVSTNGHIDPEKLASDSSSTSAGEITFATPPSEASQSPVATVNPTVATDASVSPTQDHIPPSPPAVPLPATPTTPTATTAQPASPAQRPRSRLSSPASLPLSSRPASPAINRSRAGSPAPAAIPRTASPSPALSGPASHVRGKPSASSPLAPSSRPASPALAAGPGAPPLPRRAAARRAVPPPPTSGGPKGTGDGGKQEVTPSSIAAPADSSPEVATSEAAKDAEEGAKQEVTSPVVVPEAEPRKSSEVEGAAETKGSETRADVETSVVKEGEIPLTTPASNRATETGPEPGRDDTARGEVQGAVNGTSATVVADPRLPIGSLDECSASVDTTSTKQSSTTEGEGFATNATWEERTWKELVRLKEEMFWARIGAIRSLQA